MVSRTALLHRVLSWGLDAWLAILGQHQEGMPVDGSGEHANVLVFHQQALSSWSGEHAAGSQNGTEGSQPPAQGFRLPRCRATAYVTSVVNTTRCNWLIGKADRGGVEAVTSLGWSVRGLSTTALALSFTVRTGLEC